MSTGDPTPSRTQRIIAQMQAESARARATSEEIEIDLADLFRPRPGAEPATPSREEAYRQQVRNQRAYGGMVTRRQQAAAEQRRAENLAQVTSDPQPQLLLDWFSTEFWHTEQGTYRIADMVDQHLWQTVNWCVRSCLPLYLSYEPTASTTNSAITTAPHWLSVQPAFRSLLREGIRRGLTWPRDVHDYVRQYVLDKSTGDIHTYEPWNDPQARAEQQDLASLIDMPVEVDETYGKEGRVIDL